MSSSKISVHSLIKKSQFAYVYSGSVYKIHSFLNALVFVRLFKSWSLFFFLLLLLILCTLMLELARDALNAEGYCVIGGYMSPVNDAYKKRVCDPNLFTLLVIEDIFKYVKSKREDYETLIIYKRIYI